jgi:CRISPR-associated protein Csy1
MPPVFKIFQPGGQTQKWLNGRLRGKDKKFTPQREHTRMWKSIMEKELREHTQIIDADIKFQNREQRV